MGIRQSSTEPAWVQGIDVPGAGDLVKIIDGLNAEAEVVADEIAANKGKLASLRRYTKLLYSSGSELEEVFRDSLTMLGAKVVEAKYSNEEYILEWKGREFLVEVKGNSKSISLDNVRQLLDYTIHYLKDTGRDGKGILFGNAWRLLPLSERDIREKPVFPDDVKKTAQKHGIALVSSNAFFEAFCRFLKGELSGEAILNSMTNTNGIVVF